MAIHRKSLSRKKSSNISKPFMSLGRLIALMGMGVALITFFVFTLQWHTGSSRWIYVTPSMTNEQLRDSLKAHLGSALGMKTYLLMRLQGGNAGEIVGAYEMKKGQTALSFSHRLAANRETPVRVTFTSARTVDDVVEKISSKLALSKKELLDAMLLMLPDSGFAQGRQPAAFIPNTYEFYWGAKPEKVVEKLLNERRRFWNKERMSKAQALGLDPVEVATIASIVEEETSKNSEMPLVARVYLNRLKKGMRLQADPTVKFAAGNPQLKRITGEHLSINSPYNTYRVAGLPPGPIRVPSVQAIDAVLSAPVNDNIYMCARPDFSGFHDFTPDFSTHKARAARYQKELNRRGIR